MTFVREKKSKGESPTLHFFHFARQIFKKSYIEVCVEIEEDLIIVLIVRYGMRTGPPLVN